MAKSENSEPLSLWERFRLPFAFALAGLTLISAGIYFSLEKTNTQEIKFTQEATGSAVIETVVHLSGEVVKPGVYHLPVGSRLCDLIEKAGGFTSHADQDYINKVLNLASPVKDGAKIYIPSVNESKNQVSGISTSSLININSASLTELESLEGIGEVRAQKIIDSRPYSATEELFEKKIISKSIWEKIKDKISVY